jgi:hypothetical protein
LEEFEGKAGKFIELKGCGGFGCSASLMRNYFVVRENVGKQMKAGSNWGKNSFANSN